MKDVAEAGKALAAAVRAGNGDKVAAITDELAAAGRRYWDIVNAMVEADPSLNVADYEDALSCATE